MDRHELVSKIFRAHSDDSSKRNFYFYYTDTPGECPELFLIKKIIQDGFETHLLTCLIRESSRLKP
jgi:hypothetical protein